MIHRINRILKHHLTDHYCKGDLPSVSVEPHIHLSVGELSGRSSSVTRKLPPSTFISSRC